MRKFSTLALALSLMAPAFGAKPCKVYGISDSPQTLNCSFPDRQILLTCQNGKYFLNQTPVTMAFHLEVETGTVPLVFKVEDITMTVLLNDPIEAGLEMGKAEVKGSCKRP